MPPVVAGAALAGGLSLIGGATIFGLSVAASALVVAGVALATGLITQALQPDVPSFKTQTRDRSVLARSTSEERVLVFGEVMMAGPLATFESGGDNKEFLYIAVPHSEGPCDGIVTWRINDERVGVRDEDDLVITSRFGDYVRLTEHLGDFDQAADENFITEIENWSEDHKGGGVCYTAARLQFDRDVWPNGFSNLQAQVRGLLLYDPRDTGIDIVDSTAADPAVFTTDGAHGLSVGEYVWVKGHIGADPPVAKMHRVGAVPTSIKLQLIDPDGNTVALDTGGTGGTLTTCRWSDNWALCVRAWLTYRDGFNLGDGEINETALIAAANISDEQVALTPEAQFFTADTDEDTVSLQNRRPWKTGDVVQITTTDTQPAPLALETDYYLIRGINDVEYGLATTLANARAGTAISLTSAGSGTHTITRNSQLRYTCNGVVVLGGSPMDDLEAMLSAGAGVVVYSSGQFMVYAGAATSSSASVDESDLSGGDLDILPKLPRDKIFNAARGTFVDPSKFWTLADIAPITNATYQAEDNGERIYADFTLNFTTDPMAAQRLLKIQLERVRQGATLQWPGKPRRFATAVWDVESLSVDHLGYEAKDFRVLGWVEKADQGIDLTYREEAAAMWDWNLGEETAVDLAPNSNLPSAFAVSAPQNLMISSGDDELAIGGDGTVVSGMLISWDAAPDAFADRYEVRWKLTSKSTYDGVHVGGDQTEYLVKGVVDKQVYDVKVAMRNIAGKLSDYVSDQHLVIGKSAPPPAPTLFTVRRLPDGTREFRWSLVDPPADVRVGGGVKLRYAQGMADDWDDMLALHTDILTASPWETNQLAAGDYTFAIRTVDSSGNLSTQTIFITASLGDPRLRDVLLSRDERALGWPGTKTDCFINSEQNLEAKAGAGGTWADFSGVTWDDLSGLSWLEAIPRASPIRYTSPLMDVGSDAAFEPLVSVEGLGTVTLQMRSHSAAEGPDLSGEPWASLTSAVAQRYIQIRVTMTGSTPLISAMSILLDGETAVDDFEDINTATETATWFESIAAGNFKVGIRKDAPALSHASIVALQNVGAGWTWELISKSATISGHDGPAAEFKVYNGSGTLADAVVDVQLKGPVSTPGVTPPVVTGLIGNYDFRLDSGTSLSAATQAGPTPAFSRASTATLFAEIRANQTKGSGAHRFDHMAGFGAAPIGILIEGAAENLFTDSEDFTTDIVENNCSVTANQAQAPDNPRNPDGDTLADKLVEDGTAAIGHWIYKEIAKAATPTTYTFSVFAKTAERFRFNLQGRDANSGSNKSVANFSLQNGTVTALTGLGTFEEPTARIEPVSMGWFRCSMTFTDPGTDGIRWQITLEDDSGNGDYDGDGSSGIYIWGADLKEEASQSSYVPTGAAEVTRAAETLTRDFSTSTGLATAASLDAHVRLAGRDGVILQLDDGTDDNRIVIEYDSGDIHCRVVAGGVEQADLDLGASPEWVEAKIAIIATEDDFQATLDGDTPVTDSSGTYPSGLTTLRWGTDVAGNYSNAWHLTTQIWDEVVDIADRAIWRNIWGEAFAVINKGGSYTSVIDIDSGDDLTFYLSPEITNTTGGAAAIQARNADGCQIEKAFVHEAEFHGLHLRGTGSTDKFTMRYCHLRHIGESGLSAAQTETDPGEPDTGIDDTHTNLSLLYNELEDVGYDHSGSGKHCIYSQVPDPQIIGNICVSTTWGNGISLRNSAYVVENEVWYAARPASTSYGIKYFSDHKSSGSDVMTISRNFINWDGLVDGGAPDAIELAQSNFDDDDWLVNTFIIEDNKIRSADSALHIDSDTSPFDEGGRFDITVSGNTASPSMTP